MDSQDFQIGGMLIPAPGDIEHEYQDLPQGAQCGPCPGLTIHLSNAVSFLHPLSRSEHHC